MALALELAARARGHTSPNPMVGALVVAGNRIVGKGYHRRAGLPHAEAIALKAAGLRARGATLYVTLEPCCHTNKRTPPCVPAVIASGVARVVVAMPDPNPAVGGRGIRTLRKAGLAVVVGCLRDDAEQLNEVYGHWIRTGRPFVTVKAAMTLDGKIATASGESRWITGEPARRFVHGLRSKTDAILVGIGTVLRDDPLLTARVGTKARSRQPLRVILDSTLRIPLKAKVLTKPAGSKTLGTCVATTARASRSRIKQVEARGATVLVLPSLAGRVSLKSCLEKLARQNVTSVLIEGGSEVNASALQSGLVNRAAFFLAPMLLGGQNAKGAIGGLAPARLREAVNLDHLHIRRLGKDLLLEGRVRSGKPATRTH